MAVTSGFFNSNSGDRVYNAEDFGRIFEGFFTDGILNNQRDDKFVVRKTTGLNLTVGTGFGWFKRTWIRNDELLELEASPNGTNSTRIDTVVIRADLTDEVRANTIYIKQGTANRPSLINTGSVQEYPLADITIPAGGTSINTVTDRRSEIYSTCPLIVKPYYPVGAIYISVNNTEPDILFGGTWERISGRFLIGADSDSDGGQTGGSWYHTFTINDIPAHSHHINFTTGSSTANIILRRESDGELSTVMGWAQQTAGLPSKDVSNYLPASWNFRTSYNGTENIDGTIVHANSIYATTQVGLYQDAHAHAVYGDTDATGSSAVSKEIRPPFLKVYMWKRVS